MTWGADLADGGVTLAIAILLDLEQSVHHISDGAPHLRPGRPPRLGEPPRRGKTDAEDAAVIADRVRVRRDLHPVCRCFLGVSHIPQLPLIRRGVSS
ncbi:hypothetical protein [Streptomyces sp. NPDC059787]|uniref:hypothetical protein n=1 Tax=Streptomyces sp. NPDC059787 TaxID=3346947 RepID=UPI003655EF66